MATTVYLCIGTPKTGTKALQSFLRENEELLKTKGYCYPYLNLGIESIYKDRNGQFLIYRRKGVTQEEVAEVKKKGYELLGELAGEYPNIILSEEIIWRYCNNIENFWEDVVEDFKKINCRVKVVVYLRRQDLLVQSLWNQSVKAYAKSVLTFQEYIEKKVYSYFPLDYYEQLSKIARVIEKENMIVRVYENRQFEGNEATIHSDFLKAIGLEMNEEFSKANMARNIGLDNNYVELKRILNGIPEYMDMPDFLARPMVNANLYQSEGRLHAKESMFSYEEQVAFYKQYEESNHKVAAEFLGREDGILFKDGIEELPKWSIDSKTFYEDLTVFMAECFISQEMKIKRLEEKIRDLERVQREQQKSVFAKGYNKVNNMFRKK